MDVVAEYLATEQPGLALTRLCRLARTPLGNGQYQLDNWEKLPTPKKESGELDSLLGRLQDGGAPTVDELNAKPLFWLCALDKHLFIETPPANRSPNRRIRESDETFWLVQRHRAETRRGYLPKQFGNLRYWLRFHHVIPAQPAEHPPIQIRAPRGEAAHQLTILEDRALLRVALIAFVDGVQETIANCYQGQHFTLTGLNQPELRLESAKAALNWARDQGADLLLFPELTLPAAQRRELKAWLWEQSRTPDHHISLLHLGTFHECCEQGRYHNRGELVAADGSELLCGEKRCGVTFDAKAEALEPTDPFEVLISPLGLIAMAICKDLFDGSIPNLLQLTEADWVLVPSMSNSLSPHINEAEGLHKRMGTCTLIANQPMPGTPPEDFTHYHAAPSPSWLEIQVMDLLAPPPKGKPRLTRVK
ncbi:MAG: hypothetical protein RIR00_683 [Pseudomonadota bacterium]|jgi:hypothetical protein